ncbi:MAG: response regulator [Candidatus Omnitrophica bacterium]|nr:response regulator [Candidatus Omnitrophota bacterium]
MARIKVTIVDDEEDFLKLIKTSLERTGQFEVVTINDPVNIIKDLSQNQPQVILLDILMPTMDGIEVCELLNRTIGLDKIPIIMVSALGEDLDKLKAYKMGVVDFIVKPITREDVIRKIEKAVGFNLN